MDNLIKYILDALKQHVYRDDSQVERIVAQKFEPGRAYRFSAPSVTLTDALNRDRPLLYARVSDDPFEEL